MKGHLTTLLCALALVSAKSMRANNDPSQARTICASQDSDSILVAHENCNKFYKCLHGTPVPLACPGNLVYNPEIEVCDWPENYECVDSLQDMEGPEIVLPEPVLPPQEKEEDKADKVINDDPSKAPEICAEEGSESTLVAHENCNSFYKCTAGVPAPLDCPEGLVYNPIMEYCDWPYNYKCVAQIQDMEGPELVLPEPVLPPQVEEDKVEKVINDDPSQAAKICAQEGSDSILVAHAICNRFFKCSAGLPVVFACPENLVFNPVLDVCDWSDNYACRSVINDKEGDEINPPAPVLPPAVDEKEEEEKVIYDDPSKAPEICAEEDSDSILIAHEDCNKFYKCYKGLPVPIECPENLFYNPPKEYCDWSFNVDCSDRN